MRMQGPLRISIYQQPDILLYGQIIIQIVNNKTECTIPFRFFFQNENSKLNDAQLSFTLTRNTKTTSLVTLYYTHISGQKYCAFRNSVDIVFLFKMSLMISFWTEILHMHIIYNHLIYNCMFAHLRLENKSAISCKIKQFSRFRLRKLLIFPQSIPYG